MSHTEVHILEEARKLPGRILALDLGTKRVGVAVTDESQLAVRVLPYLKRTNWKTLLREIEVLRRELDVKMLVIGLPLRLDGTIGDAAQTAQRIARNVGLSLHLPVYLQDERMTTRQAEENLYAAGYVAQEISEMIDSESAALILLDFLRQGNQ